MFRVLKTDETIKILHKKLGEGSPFTFVRYGDGEINHMDGWGGYGGNHLGSKELRKELIEGFQIDDPDYLMAIQCDYQDEEGMEEGVFKQTKNDSLREQTLRVSKRQDYLNGVAISYTAMFRPEVFKPFWDDLLKKRIMIVGGVHLEDIKDKIGADIFIEIPRTQAYYTIDTLGWYREIVDNLDKVDVVLFAAGIATNVIQKRLWLEGHKKVSLDIGALFDAILGLSTRQWMIKTKGRHDVFKQYLKEENNG